ncbi:MAG: alpha-mannosidase [Devosia sp.]|nr:alpha-mannosidase [Devosia sp.]
MNVLASKLGLLDDDIKQEEKLFRLCEDLRSKILTPISGDFAWRYTEAELSADEALKADTGSWQDFTNKTVWAKKQGHTWFAADVTVPEAARGKTFVLRFSSQWQDRPGTTDPQCLAYLDGHVAQAIDGNHTELVIAQDAVPGTKRTLLVNAFTFFDRPLVGFKVELLVRHARAEQLYFDLLTPLEVATRLTQIDGRRHAIMNLVEQSLRTLDRRGGVTPEFEASLDAAEKIAGQIYELVDTEVQPTVSAVGHTHLDVGWLWRVMHTRDKTGRSFATVLALMAEYPQFVFMYNQSVLFDFLKKDYSEIWAGVVERVKRHVGGARRQHRLGRIHGAPDHARPTLPPRAFWRGAQDRMAARHVRLFGEHAADPRALGARVFHYVEAQLERYRPAPLRHVFLARHRRHQNQGAADHGAEVRQRADFHHLQLGPFGLRGDGCLEAL